MLFEISPSPGLDAETCHARFFCFCGAWYSPQGSRVRKVWHLGSTVSRLGHLFCQSEQQPRSSARIEMRTICPALQDDVARSRVISSISISASNRNKPRWARPVRCGDLRRLQQLLLACHLKASAFGLPDNAISFRGRSLLLSAVELEMRGQKVQVDIQLVMMLSTFINKTMAYLDT